MPMQKFPVQIILLLLWLYSINADGLLASVANSQKIYLIYTYIIIIIIIITIIIIIVMDTCNYYNY